MAMKAYIGVDNEPKRVRRIYVGAKTPLPYTELEYIESDGNRFIDTGIIPDNNTRVLMDFELTEDSQGSLFGSKSADGRNAFGFYFDGNEFQSEYGESSDNKWIIDNPLERKTVEVSGEKTILDDEAKAYVKEDFSSPETLKIMASGQGAELSYMWYYNGEIIEGENTDTLRFRGCKCEEGIYRVDAMNEGKIVSSKECKVTVVDNSLLSGKRYTHNVPKSNWYEPNPSVGKTNPYDADGTYLTDGNIFKDYWCCGYFASKGYNPEIEFNLGEAISFKELSIHFMSGTAGIHLPSKVTIEYKNGSSDWICVYDDEASDNDLVLTLDKKITATDLRFKIIRSGAYVFIDEIRAFSEHTGVKSKGILKMISPNKNILLGKEYTHNVTTWYKGSSRDKGNALTDGYKAGGYDSTDYLNAQQKSVYVQFDFDSITDVRELHLDFITNSGAGVYAPNVEVFYKNDDEWISLFNGEGKASLTLVAQKNLKASALKFNFTATRNSFIFVNEIEAYSRVTGNISDGELIVPETPEFETAVYAFRDLREEETTLLNGDPTPIIVKDLDLEKSVLVGEKFKLSVVATSGQGTVSDYVKGRIYSCKIFDKDKLVREFIPCQNQDGEVGLFDKISNEFYLSEGATGSLTPGGVISETSIGTGVAKRVRRAYIGVGGVARPCFTYGELVHYGKIDDLSVARQGLAATTVGNYAIFGGGSEDGTGNVVDAYNSYLQRTNITSFSIDRSNLAAVSVGNYAVFAGGNKYHTGIEVYDNDSLGHSVSENKGIARLGLAATTVGDYALFGGGSIRVGEGLAPTAIVEAFNSSLIRTSASDLNVGREYLAAAPVGDYALFAGGYDDSKELNIVDAYDVYLVHRIIAPLSSSRMHLAGTGTRQHAFFGGGEYGKNWAMAKNVDVYNAELERTTVSLSNERAWLSSTSIDTFALFGGGNQYDAENWRKESDVVDAFDEFLTRTIYHLSSARENLAATTIGNYALFAGGTPKGSTVDVFLLK